jgi:predicted anti-sigma-YlaC factor YlaD
MECSEVREHLSAFDESEPPMSEISAHLESCEGCRDEQRRFQELAAAMGELEATPLEPPAWLLASLTETTLERMRRIAAIKATRKQIGEHRVAAGSAAIVLAGVAGALFMGRRRRSRRLRVASLTGLKAAA